MSVRVTNAQKRNLLTNEECLSDHKSHKKAVTYFKDQGEVDHKLVGAVVKPRCFSCPVYPPNQCGFSSHPEDKYESLF